MLSPDSGSTEHRVAISGGYYFDPARSSSDNTWDESINIEDVIEQRSLRRLDPLSQCALYVVENARRAAGIADENSDTNAARHGVCVGTAFGAQNTRIRYARRLAKLGPAATNPIDFPDSIDGAPAAHIAIRWGLQGPSLTFVSGMASAVDALVAACRQIASGSAERMYVVAGDVFNPFLRKMVAASLRSLGVDSENRDGVGSTSRPKDAVVALILERIGKELSGAPAIEVVGFHGSNCNEEIAGPANLIRDVNDPTKNVTALDLSGASMLAVAWLGVAAPMGKWAGLCQDNGMNVRGYRCKIRDRRHPNLAFLRFVS